MVDILGIDKHILSKCRFREQFWYDLVSFFALINVVLSFAGFFYFFLATFDSFIIAVVVGLFWSLIFLNLQRFIIQTVSGRKMRFSVFVSVLMKLSIVGFFAVITAFPLQLMIMKPFLEKEMTILKTEKRKEMLEELDLIFGAEELTIKNQIKKLQNDITAKEAIIKSQEEKLKLTDDLLMQKEITASLSALKAECMKIKKGNTSIIRGLELRLVAFENKRKTEIKQFEAIISSSSMIIERSKLLIKNNKRFTKIAFGVVIFLFWFPVLFKQITAPIFEYDRYKSSMEKEYIKNNFQAFKIRYKNVLSEKTNVMADYPSFRQPN